MSTKAEEVPPEVAEARRKLREKMGEGAQVGGKGSMRRKSKPIPKSNHNDEKKVAEIAKKAGLQEIPAMDEADIIFHDGSVTQIMNPKVKGLLQANSFVIHGSSQQKSVQNLDPNMRGDSLQQGGGAGGARGDPLANMPPHFASAALKFKTALEASGISDKDMQDPSKANLIGEVLEKANLTGPEREILEAMMSMGGGGAQGASAADDVPTLDSNKTFEEVADAD